MKTSLLLCFYSLAAVLISAQNSVSLCGQPKSSKEQAFKDCCPLPGNGAKSFDGTSDIFGGKQYKYRCNLAAALKQMTVSSLGPGPCVEECSKNSDCISAMWDMGRTVQCYHLLVTSKKGGMIIEPFSAPGCQLAVSSAVASAQSVAETSCQSRVSDAASTAKSDAQVTAQTSCQFQVLSVSFSVVSSAQSAAETSCQSHISSAVSIADSSAKNVAQTSCQSQISVTISSAVSSAVSAVQTSYQSELSSAVSSAVITAQSAAQTSCQSHISSVASNAAISAQTSCQSQVSSTISSAVSSAQSSPIYTTRLHSPLDHTS